MALALPPRLRGEETRERFPAPQDFADAVELYARRFGRHGRMYFVEILNVWVVELKQDEFWADGHIAEEPTEIFYLYRPPTPAEKSLGAPNIGYTLEELGVNGMINYLEQTNTLTGRGEHGSQVAAAMAQLEQQRVGTEKVVADIKTEAIYKQQQKRKLVEGVQQKGWTRELETAPTSAPTNKVVI